MKTNKLIGYFLVMMLLVNFLMSCTPEIDGVLTLQQDKIGEYLDKNPKKFGSFYKVVEKAGILGLLNSYGSYTCFAPNNAAIDSFIARSSFKNLNNFPVDSLKKLVLYQLIENDAIYTTDFTPGRLRSNNMAGDNLQVALTAGDSAVNYKINETANILSHNIPLKNGVLHETNSFIMPSTNNVYGKIGYGIGSDSTRYSLFFEALKRTGIYLQLAPIKDNRVFWNDLKTIEIPRKFKFTVFVESNELYKANQIENFDQLAAVYDPVGSPKHGIYTDPENELYRFVAYHCLDRIYDSNSLHTFTSMQPDGSLIIPTMCPNSLIEYKEFPEGGMLNKFTDANGGVLTSGVALDPQNKNILANNGMIHEVTKILEIPDMNMYFQKKMRFNMGGLMPELINNDFKGKKAQNFLNPGSDGIQFFKNMTVNGLTGNSVIIYSYTGIWTRHQWDEIMIGNGGEESKTVRSEVILTTPPIPEGRWEIRLGYTHNQYKGMFQFFWDDEPQGVPQNMYMFQDYGIAGMDDATALKVLKNNGLLLFPTNIIDNQGKFVTLSNLGGWRKVITVQSFSKMETHTLRIKSVSTGVLSLCFFEVIPVDQVPFEQDN